MKPLQFDFIATPTLAHPRPARLGSAWQRIAFAAGGALLVTALAMGLALQAGHAPQPTLADDGDDALDTDDTAPSNAVAGALQAMHRPWLPLLDTLEERLATSANTTVSITSLEVRGPERQIKLMLQAPDASSALRFAEHLRQAATLSQLRPTQQDQSVTTSGSRISMTLEGPWPHPPVLKEATP
jgi:hypothetical protein